MITTSNKKKFENKLYTEANRIVGKVGESTLFAEAINDEPYITIIIKINQSKDNNWCVLVLSIWRKWIKNYIGYAQYMMPKNREVMKDTPMTIYWRIKPELLKLDDNYYIRARLLISQYKSLDRTPGVYSFKIGVRSNQMKEDGADND